MKNWRRRIEASEVAVDVGTLAHDPRQHVYLQHRDGVMVHGPTGSGKTWRIAYQRACDAPGFLLATTTKVDLLAATITRRAQQGRVAIFDPEELTGWPVPLRWSILSGCADPDTAIRRADALARAMPLDGAKNGAYFEGKAATLLRCYLHAAAVEGLSIRDVRVWVSSRTTRTAIDILADRLPDWAGELDQILGSGSDSSDDVLAAAARLLEPLASPKMLAAVDVPVHRSFDVESFVRGGANSLYLVSKGSSKSMAPFVTALAAEVHHILDRSSQHMPGGRHDPPVRLLLDEMNNVAPIPDMPAIMTDSGGKGINVWAIAHNQDQNELRWGRIGGRILSQSAPAMIVLPGLRSDDELASLSRLLGTRKHWQASLSRGSRTYQLHDEQVLTAAQIRQLPTDQGLLLYRNAPAMLLRLPTVWDDRRLTTSVTESHAVFDRIVETGEVPAIYLPQRDKTAVVV